MPVRVFVSYARQDAVHLAAFRQHVRDLERANVVFVDDQEIGSGERWVGWLDEQIDAADVVVALVTPAFVASDFCMTVELPRALARVASGACVLFPVNVERVYLAASNVLWQVQRVPSGSWLADPVTGKVPASAWADVVEALDRRLDELPSRSRRPGWSLASQPDLRSHWLPLARGAGSAAEPESWHFAGRQRALAAASAWLGLPPGASEVRGVRVVTGTPGVGKSALIAHLLALTDAVIRPTVPRRYRGAVPAELVGRVGCAVRATDLDQAGLIEQIAAALGIGTSDRETLLLALADHASPFAIVVDGLDEASPGEAGAMCGLLAELGEDPRRMGVRVLVGLRSAPQGSATYRLHRKLGADRVEWDLDGEFAEPEALADYVRGRLVGDSATEGWPTPYRDEPDLAARIARAVAERADGNFLVAALTSRYLAAAAEPVEIREGWTREFPDSVPRAMDAYLARFGQDEQQRIRDLLMPLAFARGQGLPPDGQWAQVAAALSRRPYCVDGVHDLFDTAAAFLLERSGGTERRTYRLYHRAMDQYLREECRVATPEAAIAQALIAATPRGKAGHPAWERAEPYTLAHLAEHAEAGGAVGPLLEDAAFLVYGDPRGLVRVAAHMTDIPAAQVYDRAAHRLGADPGERAAYLAFAARQAGENTLAQELLAVAAGEAPWLPIACRWDPAPPSRVLLTLERSTTATALMNAQMIVGTESVVAVTGNAEGQVTLHVLAIDAVAESEPPRRAHDAAVTTAAIGRPSAGQSTAVTGAADGTLRFWHIDDGLLVPLPEPPIAHPAKVVAAAFGPGPSGREQVLTIDEGGGWVLWDIGRYGVDVVGRGTCGRTGVASVALPHRPAGPAGAVLGTRTEGVAWLPLDGSPETVIATGTGTGTSIGAVMAWPTGSGAVVVTGSGRVFWIDTDEQPAAALLLEPGIGGLLSCAVGPAGSLALGSWDGDIALLRFPPTSTGDRSHADLTVVRAHQDAAEALVVLSDNEDPAVVVSMGRDHTIAASAMRAPAHEPGFRVAPYELAAATVAGSAVVVAALRQVPAVPGEIVELWASEDDGFRKLDLPAPATSTVGVAMRTRGPEGMMTSREPGLGPRKTPRAVPMRAHQAIAAAALPDRIVLVTATTGDRLQTHRVEPRRAVVFSAQEQGQPWIGSMSLAADQAKRLLLCTAGTTGDLDLWLIDPDPQPSPPRRVMTPSTLAGEGPRVSFVHSTKDRPELICGDATGMIRRFSVADDTLSPIGAAWAATSEPITGIAAIGHDRVVVGDRSGAVGLWAIDHAEPHCLNEMHLPSTVLAATFIDPDTTLLWCREGGVRIRWRPHATEGDG